jgi:uncharacterized protein involved in tellurium resistance
MELGLEVKSENNKYTLIPLLQNAGQNLDIKRVNKYFENVKKN